MKTSNQTAGLWLEAGIAAFALSLLVGSVLYIVGNTKNQSQSHAQKQKGPAASEEVSPERHQNIANVASR